MVGDVGRSIPRIADVAEVGFEVVLEVGVAGEGTSLRTVWGVGC